MMPEEKRNGFTLSIFLFLLSLLVFEIIAWDWWRHGPSSQLDFKILRHTPRFISSHPWFSQFVGLAAILGKSWFLWTLVIFGGIFLAWKKDWPALLFLLIVAALGNLLVEPVKAWFQRPRPLPSLPGARGFSFPSSSAYLAAVVYGALAFWTWPHIPKCRGKFVLLLGALAAVLLVGLSRLFLRLHWLTDVLAAYALASSWLLLNVLIYQKIKQAFPGLRPTRKL